MSNSPISKKVFDLLVSRGYDEGRPVFVPDTPEQFAQAWNSQIPACDCCGKYGSAEMHQCPYDADLRCHCCAECEAGCARDI